MVLVTGASGHVGANLVRALLQQGRDVRCLVHSDTRALEGLDVQTHKGDVTSPESLTPAFRDVEVVYHCAAVISIVGEMRANGDFTKTALGVTIFMYLGVILLFSITQVRALGQP